MKEKDMRQYLMSLEGLKEELRLVNSHITEHHNTEVEVNLSPVLSDMPSAHEGSDKTANLAIWRVEKIVDLKSRKEELLRIIFSITSVLCNMNQIEKEIIENRYLMHEVGKRNPSMDRVSEMINMDISTVWRCENRVLKRMIVIYDEYFDKKKSLD